MSKQTAVEKRKRILTFDLLRGGFLVAIIVDHLNWGPSLWHVVSGGGTLWASPAEGFFAISGILVGYIYGPRLARSFTAAAKGLWKRAFLLYSLGVVFTLAYTVVALIVNQPSLPPVWQRSGESFLINTLLGRYAYGWTDFLPRYAVFMAVSPFLLWLVVKGRAWIVATGSIAVWVFFHKTPLLLPFSSWEIIFIPGIILGYYLPTLQHYVASLPQRVRTTLQTSLWVIASTSFIASSLVFVALPMLGTVTNVPPQIAALFDKNTVGIGRLLLGAVWFWALYSVVRRYEAQISRATHQTLETLGAKSLYTYCIHGFVVFFITLLVPTPPHVSVLDSTLFAVTVVCTIYILVISPAVARWLDYEYHKYLVARLLRYNVTYEPT